MKKIAVFSGTRAEYGLLRGLIQKLKNDSAFSTKLIVSGTHLSPEFGLTYKEIESDKFLIDEKVEMLLSSDSAVGVSKSMGLGLISYSESLMRLQPDLLIILGDRFEALAMAQAAMLCRIPIAHINGGEATFGLIDEAIRHAITKMSHLHFTSTERYSQRVIQLGERPECVFNVGALGVENCLTVSKMSRMEVESDLGFKFQKRNILITFHPVTLENSTSADQVRELLQALDLFPEIGLVFTKANADMDGRVINDMLEAYCQKRPHSLLRASLGLVRYLSVLDNVDLVLGNSSSGIIEVPSFHIPTVNIGDRQKGRIQADSIINCEPKTAKLVSAIEKAFSQEFKLSCQSAENPYGNGKTSEKIVQILRETEFKNLLKKEFYDLPG